MNMQRKVKDGQTCLWPVYIFGGGCYSYLYFSSLIFRIYTDACITEIKAKRNLKEKKRIDTCKLTLGVQVARVFVIFFSKKMAVNF